MQRLRKELAHVHRQLHACRLALVPNEVSTFLEKHKQVHLAGGGLGDAWLTVAALSQERDAHLLFAANTGIERLAGQIFRLFGIPTLIVPSFGSSPVGLVTFQYAWEHLHCVSRGYLPANLDYSDWARHPEQYVARLVTWLPVREKFGCAPNPRPTTRLVALAPRGSDTCRPFERKRLTVEEYRQLVGQLLVRDCTVVTVGSEKDLAEYGLYPHSNHIWLSSDWRVSYPEHREPSTLELLLAVVNGCDEVIAVDTWLKTYSALACVPTTVIATRYDEPYENPGDQIFLNPLWEYRRVKIEDLLSVGS